MNWISQIWLLFQSLAAKTRPKVIKVTKPEDQNYRIEMVWISQIWLLFQALAAKTCPKGIKIYEIDVCTHELCRGFGPVRGRSRSGTGFAGNPAYPATRKCWTLSWFFSRRAEFLISSYKSIIMQLLFLWLGYGVRLSNHCNGVAYSSTHWCMWLCILAKNDLELGDFLFQPFFFGPLDSMWDRYQLMQRYRLIISFWFFWKG